MKFIDLIKKYGLSTVLAFATLDGYRRSVVNESQSSELKKDFSELIGSDKK